MRCRLTFVEILILLAFALLVVGLAGAIWGPEPHCNHAHGTCERGWDQ